MLYIPVNNRANTRMIAIVIYMFLLNMVLAQPPDCASLDVEPTLEVAVDGKYIVFIEYAFIHVTK